MTATRRAVVVLAAGHLLAGWFLLAPSYIRPDSVALLSWLRSLVFDGDLLFFNEWAGFGMISSGVALFKEVTPVGALANHWWIGSSVMLAPFYLAARAVDALTGIGKDTGGFFGLYAVVLAWGVLLFGALTWWVSDRMIARVTTLRPGTRTLLLLSLWVGTPILWYELRMPIGSHIPGALCVAVLVWLLSRLSDGTEERWLAFAAGLALGLAIATRLQHFVLIPAVLIPALASRRPFRFYAEGAAGVSLPILVQALAWYVVYGSPAGPLGGGANLGGTTWMPFATVNLDAVLVSSWHGLFTWAPITVVALLGWAAALRGRHRVLAATLVLMFVGEWLANGLFDRYWWGGMSFGPRRFADLAAPFAIGLGWAAVRWRRPAVAACVLTGLWGAGLALSAMAGKLELARDVGPRELVRAALTGFVPAIRTDLLRSAAVDPSIRWLTILSIAIAGAVLVAGVFLFRTVPRAIATVAALLLVALFAAGAALAPTRDRAAAASETFRIDPARTRLGPLLDQQKLLGDELAWERRTGKGRSAETARLLQDVDRAVAQLQQ